MKRIFKRANKNNNENMFLSEYLPSYKYGVISLIQPTETHMGGLADKFFRTKSEAEAWVPKFANVTYDDMKIAEMDYNFIIKEAELALNL